MSEVTTLRPSGSSGGGKKLLWDTPANEPRVTIKFGQVYSLDEMFHSAIIMADAYNEIARLIRPLDPSTNDPRLEKDYVGRFRTRYYKQGLLFCGRSTGSFTKYTCNPPSEDDLANITLVNRKNEVYLKLLDDPFTTAVTDNKKGTVNSENKDSEDKTEPTIEQSKTTDANETETSVTESKEGTVDFESKDNEKVEPTIEQSKTTDMNEIEMSVAKTVSELGQPQRRSPRQHRSVEKYAECTTRCPATRRILPTRKNSSKTNGISVQSRSPENPRQDGSNKIVQQPTVNGETLDSKVIQTMDSAIEPESERCSGTKESV
jgi:hypothetical protein